jgi:hypothetical protein
VVVRDEFCTAMSRTLALGTVPRISETTMTPLRQRMIDAMVLRGFAARTQETYLCAVGQLARHHHLSPPEFDSPQRQERRLFQSNQRFSYGVAAISVMARFPGFVPTFTTGSRPVK